MYQRNIGQALEQALADTRAVLVTGPRQSGKSTLVRAVAERRGGRYVSLDDETALASAKADPAAFLSGSRGMLVIDEVQKAPGLLPAIKLHVDRDPRPGRFLLTGSTNAFLIPDVTESLAGRLEILPIAPLTQDELAGTVGTLPDRLFDGTVASSDPAAVERVEACARLIAGGFPEAVDRPAMERRIAWHRSYISSILQRDVRDLSAIEGLTDLPRLLSLLAARTGGLLNMSELSRSTQIPHTTLRRHLSLLEATYLFAPLPSWTSNLGKRLIKSPKIHLVDSGLTCHLRGHMDAEALAGSDDLGPMLESFVLQQLRAQLAWATTPAVAYHYRTPAGREVDIVLEAAGGRVVGIEVKASSAVGPTAFAGLRALAEDAGDRFVRGVVLHLGRETVPFGDRLWAVPIAALWEDCAGAAPGGGAAPVA